MSPLIYPNKITEIHSLIDSLREKHGELFKYFSRYDVENRVYTFLGLLGFGTGRLSKSRMDSFPEALLDAYSFHRACNQANEACNKLWATIELVYAVSPSMWRKSYEPMGKYFENEFLLGSLVPALYYSQLSAIVSCLSSFGCVSIRDETSNISYNIVRTQRGWRIYERKKYIKDTFGLNPQPSWHIQVAQLLKGFEANILDFPKIDYSGTDGLRRKRNITHYDILSRVSASRVTGINQYFKYLPLCTNTINSALSTIKKISWLPSYSGARRFRELHSNLPRLYEAYKKQYPLDKINKVEF